MQFALSKTSNSATLIGYSKIIALINLSIDICVLKVRFVFLPYLYKSGPPAATFLFQARLNVEPSSTHL